MIDPGLMDMIMRLRSRGISDTHVLRAIEQVPRKAFVDIEYLSKVYDPIALPIKCGQTLSDPFTIAIMTQMAGLRPSHKLLEIGTGSGYHAAILSKMVKRVYSVERYKLLISDAEKRFQELDIVNTVIRHGDGRYGWPGQAPFDRIIITCGVIAAPDGLLDQLATDGVMIAVIDGQLTRIKKARKRFTEDVLIPLKLPVIEAGKSQAL